MPLKVCHLLLSFGNKNQSYTQELLEAMHANMEAYHFVYCHSQITKSKTVKVVKSRCNSKIVQVLMLTKLYLTNARFRRLHKDINTYEILKWLRLIQQSIDVLHIHHLHTISPEVIQYFKDKGVKIVISLRGRDILVNTLNEDSSNVLKEKLLLADDIHSISCYINDVLKNQYGLDGKVVYRGQSLPEIAHIKTANTFSGVIKILVVGRLVWEKGHIFLIESIGRLVKAGHKVEVDIYGSGNIKELLSFRIKQLQLENVIHFKGFVSHKELKKGYKHYDIAVQPSLSEALSNGLIDFMMHNLPCVITDVGGMTEIISHKKNGIVFSAQNMVLLDDAILEANRLNFETLMSFNAQIIQQFDKATEVKGLMDIYKTKRRMSKHYQKN